MTTRDSTTRWPAIAVVLLLGIAGAFGALALIKLFGDLVCFTVFFSFVLLTVYAWHKTDTQQPD